jgi:hypothetical protein
MVVLTIPTGNTNMFSIRENTTLAMPSTTAMNSSQVVLLNSLMNCCTIEFNGVNDGSFKDNISGPYTPLISARRWGSHR